MTGNRGPYTGCDLGDVTPLCMPWREIHYQLRPPFSRAAALLSLELASSAYDMQIFPWREAGWHDISYQVDNALFSGPAINGENARGEYSNSLSGYYQRRVSSLVNRQNPISQLRGALRQRESSDTCKSLVMIHRCPGGRYLVAIGFMGTGKRLYDWISNFRTQRDRGMHKGFLQLAEGFQRNYSAIEFPETAREIGREKLTLSDIFAECRRPGSRFLIWMAGHSQGGAVMQLIAWRAVREGCLRQNLIGYGFASPSVLYENPGMDLDNFPLFHIINGDDAIPRVGALLHIGKCLICQPDRAMRTACYPALEKEAVLHAAFSLYSFICSTQTCQLHILALLKAVEALPHAESVTIIHKTLGKALPEKLTAALGERTDQLLRHMIRRAEITYARSNPEVKLSEGLVRQYQLRIASEMKTYGAQPLIRALLQVMGMPHRLRSLDPDAPAPYQYIVLRRFSDLRFFPTCGSVPRAAGRPIRGRKAPPIRRFHRAEGRRNQSVIR